MQFASFDTPKVDFNSLSSETFARRLQQFRDKCADYPIDIYWALAETIPIPLCLQKSTLQELNRISNAIADGVQVILENYLKDSRISSIIALSEAELKLVEKLYEAPLPKLGALRPDFIIDCRGVPRVCEINGRFPVNGFFLSRYFDQIMEDDTNNQWQATGVAGRVFEQFVPNQGGLAIKGAERGWDIHFLAEEARNKGIPFRFVGPSDKSINTLLESNQYTAQSIFVELHQVEFATLSAETIKRINERDPLNDLRVVLIAHDKRALQVLSNPAIMADYLPDETQQILSRHIIPTFRVAVDEHVVESALQNKSSWLLKAHRYGKSEGIYFGDDVNQERWQALLKSKSTLNYVLQPKIEPFYIHLDKFAEMRGERRGLQVVGTLLQLNGEFLGVGLFRCSAGKKLDKQNRVFTLPVAASTPTSREFVW